MSDWGKQNARALLRGFRSLGLATEVRITNYSFERLIGVPFATDDELAGADFTGSDLTAASFAFGTDLTGTRFIDALLPHARLDGVDLQGANLTNASLFHASLLGADLRHATLDGAQLRRARLIGAKLPPGIDLTGSAAARPDDRPRLEMTRSGWFQTIACHPQDDLLAAARGTGVEIWDTRAWWPITCLDGHTDLVWGVAWSPDGARLATVGNDGLAIVWDTDTGARLHTISQYAGAIRAVAWSPDGALIATGGRDSMVRLWDPDNGRLVRSLVGHTLAISSVCWSPDGSAVASGGRDRTVRIWDRASGARIRTLEVPGEIIRSIDWSHDGLQLAAGCDDGGVRIWEAANGRLAQVLRTKGIVWAVAWHPQRPLLAIAADSSAVTLVTRSGRTQHVPTSQTNPDTVRALTWARGGYLVVTGRTPVIEMFETTTGGIQASVLRSVRGIRELAWSPDADRLGASTDDGRIQIWATSAYDALVGESSGTSVAWLPTGQWVIGADRGFLVEGRPGDFASQTLPGVAQMTASSDGRLATVTEGGLIAIWHPGSKQPLFTFFNGPRTVQSIAWSFDGRLATASNDRVIRVFDAATGKEVIAFDGHTRTVRSVAWSRDGRLATGGNDGTARVWDPTTGTLLNTLSGQASIACSVAWSPDGTLLATASHDHAVRIWRPVTDDRQPAPLSTRRLEDPAHTVAWAPTGDRLAVGLTNGCIVLLPVDEDPDVDVVRLLGLGGREYAVFYDDDRYVLRGESAGRFWWSAGLCRFEPGELDAYGVQAL